MALAVLPTLIDQIIPKV